MAALEISVVVVVAVEVNVVASGISLAAVAAVNAVLLVVEEEFVVGAVDLLFVEKKAIVAFVDVIEMKISFF